MSARRLLLAASAALLLAGCGDRTSIQRGGRVSGMTMSVFSILPLTGAHARAAADIVRGEKLALAQAGGRVGELTVNFASLDEPEDPAAVATVVREAIRDQSIIAVIGDLDSRSARVSAPLLNAGGILHVSPGAGATITAEPSGTRSFSALVPSDQVQAAAIARVARGKVAVEAEGGEAAQALADAIQAQVGGTVGTGQADTVVYAGSDPVNARGVVEGVLAENPRARVLLPQELWSTDLPDSLRGRARVRFVTTVPATGPPGFDAAFRRAYPGLAPGPHAQVGWSAMRAVLAAIRRAGPRAQNRQAVIDAYFAADPVQRADAQPFRWTPQGR